MTNIPLMIDSGAYSAWTKKETLDLDSYISFIHEKILPDFPHAVYVNLDVIGDGKASYKNWRRMRKAGLEPLPIYHVSTDEKWLRKYLAVTDYIGLGAIANMTSSKRIISLDRIWGKYLIGKDRMPTAKVHGMGITSYSLMKRYPWYSIDSTSYQKSAWFGKVLLPKYVGGKWRYDKPYLVIGVTHRTKLVKEKGQHINSFSPIELTLFLRYLKENNIPLGKSKLKKIKDKNGKEKIEEDIIEQGIINNFEIRCYMGALYYSRSIQSYPYPRPFLKGYKGLLK